MSRERLLTLYALALGGLGCVWLAVSPGPLAPFAAIILFGALALAVDALSFRLPTADVYSLAGVVLVAASLALGPRAGALIALTEGILSGIILSYIYGRPASFYLLVARPLMRGGVRATGLLAGAALASLVTGQNQFDPASLDPLALLLATIPALTAVTLGARVGRELLQGGKGGLAGWWRGSWAPAVAAEVAPLPLALLGAANYTELGSGYFLLFGFALVATAAAVRRATLNLATQRRSVRELALLNEVSRAIIRSELKVETLSELIYREAGKIVDTSSFHLGLFEGDRYTLVVRVQDRVRLPPLVVDLEANDGLIGWMRQTGRALLIEDFLEEMDRLPARPRYQSERPPRSGIYVPLIAGDHVIGSISVQSYAPGAFSASDLRLLSLIADQAAVAITRARAFDEARRRAVQLQAIQQVSERITAILDLDLLLPAVVRLIRERFGYHPVHIFTLDPTSDRIRFRASTSVGPQLEQVLALPLTVGQGLVGSAAATGQLVVVNDVRLDPRYIRDSRTTISELAVPLRVGEQIVGVLDLQSDEAGDFDADDLFVMRTLADQIAVAIDSANMYRAQQEEAWTLNALLQVAENIGRANSLTELIATVVRLPSLLLGAARCYLLIWDAESETFCLEAAYGGETVERKRHLGANFAPAQAPLLGRIWAAGIPTGPRLLKLEAMPERREVMPAFLETSSASSLASLPLLGRSGLLGALILAYDVPKLRLDARQTNLWIGAAAQIAAALESLRLAQEAELVARFEQELKVAREIQTALLPAAPPVIDGWQIASAWEAARLVGGDFFDFWPLPSAHEAPILRRTVGERKPTLPPDLTARPPDLGFVIADVSDKGVPAAMFMALARSLVRAAALDGTPPAQAMERANRWIMRDSDSGMFVTLFYGILDPSTGRVRYTVGGHNPPLLVRAKDGATTELRTPGIALGVLDEITLGEADVTLEPGDVLVCYTDGVSEAVDDHMREFGVERLRNLVIRHRHLTAGAIVEAILADLANHARGQPAFDDVTLVVLRRLD